MGNRKVELTELFRGSKSRNKVSVGEPAEGSLTNPSRCRLRAAMVKHRALAIGDGRVSARFLGGVRLALNGVTHLNRWKPIHTVHRASNRVLPSLVLSVKLFVTLLYSWYVVLVVKVLTTSDGGSLGSCIDEERSKLRYLV